MRRLCGSGAACAAGGVHLCIKHHILWNTCNTGYSVLYMQRGPIRYSLLAAPGVVSAYSMSIKDLGFDSTPRRWRCIYNSLEHVDARRNSGGASTRPLAAVQLRRAEEQLHGLRARAQTSITDRDGMLLNDMGACPLAQAWLPNKGQLEIGVAQA